LNGGEEWPLGMKDNYSADCILVGGGLANSLIALAMRRAQPHLRIKIIERGDRIGGNHTWSFHSTDFAAPVYEFLKPLIVKSWDGQEVRFPKYRRALGTRYNTVTSERLHDAVMQAFGDDVMLNAEVAGITPSSVELKDGRSLAAPCVIDGRGPPRDGAWQAGYQKFFGLEVELEAPHGLAHPIIMDATVEQIDGYRFVYTLPFDERRILIEDTYYASGTELDDAALEARVRGYASKMGWRIARIIRRERGVLPIPYVGNHDRLWAEAADGQGPRAGLRALLFHPTTGYSLPDAADTALWLSRLERPESEEVARLVRERSAANWERRSFFRMLNRLLFIAAEPHERLNVMQRFYTLPEALIRRFYACDLTLMDKTRILTGKPPVSFFRALACVKERA
jgi:lycopene beta-cyclase